MVKNLRVAFVAALLFALWLTPGWWNLGWGIIGSGIVLYVIWSNPLIRKDRYLGMLAGADLGLTLLMWQWNNGSVKALSFIGWWFLTGSLVVLAKNPKGEVGWTNTFLTFFKGVTTFILSGIEIIGLVGTKKSSSGRGKQIGVGVALSLVVLLVFGSLFYSADPLFARLISSIPILKINLDSRVFGNIFWSVLFLLSIYTLLKSSLVKQAITIKKVNLATELTIVSVVAVLLFFVFGALQIKYFISSAAALEKMGIMLSEYTRRGYGEMIFAGFLAFIMIALIEHLGASTLLKKLRIVFLTEIVWLVVAATRRNYLYQANYGLTEARILGFFVSVWLLLACVIFIIKMLRERDNGWLVKKLVLTTGVVLIGLNITPIDRLIAEGRVPTLGYGIDYYYLANLSSDGYQGWDKVLTKVEGDLKSYPNVDDTTVWGAEGLIGYMRSKLDNTLNPQSEHYWHYLGAWNPNSEKGRKYLLDNWERIKGADDQLRAAQKRIDERNNQVPVKGTKD